MESLLQLQDFRDFLEISRKLNIRLNLPDNSEAPFYTCRVILPWPFSFEIALQFRNMVRFIHRNLFVQTDIRDYQVTLVTENYETEMALILLLLASTAQALDEDDKGYTPSFMQFIWLLTVVKTVKDGLTRDSGEEDEDEDRRWEPESAFGRIHEELVAKLRKDKLDEVIAELGEISRALENKGIVDEGV